MKTKNVSQWVDVNATLPSGSISVEISQDVTPGENQVDNLNAKQIERKVNLVAAKRTKKNPKKWVVKKRGCQIGELDQLKLKTVVLHDGIGKEIHMTQLVGFVTADLKIIDLVA